MDQQRQPTVTRRWVNRPGAQRRWDRAYQMVLQTAAERLKDGDAGAAPTAVPKESRHADSRLRPGLDAASGAGPDD
jgi:hypothetical protein